MRESGYKVRHAIVRTRASVMGFTLIETVVALAILALTLAVVYQSFGQTLQRGADQRQRDLAWLAAQSILDEMRGNRLITRNPQSGSTREGLAWEARVEPYAPQLEASNAIFGPSLVTALRLLEVSIIVRWGKGPGKRVELHTVELGAMGQPVWQSE